MPSPRLVRPRPIRAPAVIIAPMSARMVGPPGLVADRSETAGEHQDNAGDDHQEAAAAAAAPRAVRAPGIIAEIAAAAERSDAHVRSLLVDMARSPWRVHGVTRLVGL